MTKRYSRLMRYILDYLARPSVVGPWDTATEIADHTAGNFTLSRTIGIREIVSSANDPVSRHRQAVRKVKRALKTLKSRGDVELEIGRHVRKKDFFSDEVPGGRVLRVRITDTGRERLAALPPLRKVTESERETRAAEYDARDQPKVLAGARWDSLWGESPWGRSMNVTEDLAEERVNEGRRREMARAEGYGDDVDAWIDDGIAKMSAAMSARLNGGADPAEEVRRHGREILRMLDEEGSQSVLTYVRENML